MTTAPDNASAGPPADSTPGDVESVVETATVASRHWAAFPERDRAQMLRQLADALDAAAEELAAVADAETSLGLVRLRGEVSRTTRQLRMFATYIASYRHVDAIITEAGSSSTHPDIRRMLVPVGPAAVFAAGNFPFAFSVAGGDSASVLAAGCAAVVKAHPGHPRTSKMVNDIVVDAVAKAGAPTGLLATVYGPHAGRALVVHPSIKGVAFTGSTAGGRALLNLAMSRLDPIPFYGELGSVNPVIVLPKAANVRAAEIAQGYAESLTLGTGQFCTKPGLLFVPDDAELLSAIALAVADTVGATMLTEGIFNQYQQAMTDDVWADLPVPAHGKASGVWAAEPQIRQTSLVEFQKNLDVLSQERFGPAGLVVTYTDLADLLAMLATLPGSLTASVHAEDAELETARHVAVALAGRAGRLIFNGWPTGVAVCWAMHHGGPWPASTTPWTTSVGATAIRRWLMPVAYQNWPDVLLPPALRRGNPLAIHRVTQPQA